MNLDDRIRMTRLLDELSGDKCRCGKLKRQNQTFCWQCYKSLPREMQADLYKRFGMGYEEAYAAACKYFARKIELADLEAARKLAQSIKERES